MDHGVFQRVLVNSLYVPQQDFGAHSYGQGVIFRRFFKTYGVKFGTAISAFFWGNYPKVAPICAWRPIWLRREGFALLYKDVVSPSGNNIGGSASAIYQSKRENVAKYTICPDVRNDPRSFRTYKQIGATLRTLSIQQGGIGRILSRLGLPANFFQVAEGGIGGYGSDDDERPIRPDWWPEPLVPIVRLCAGGFFLLWGRRLIHRNSDRTDGIGWARHILIVAVLFLGLALLLIPGGW